MPIFWVRGWELLPQRERERDRERKGVWKRWKELQRETEQSR